MKKLFCLITAVLICTGGAFFVRAETASSAGSRPVTRNSITGFVYNASRQPLSDVYVELQNDVYSTLARARTTGAGFFAFHNLADGRYNVNVLPLKTDYEQQGRYISLFSVSPVGGRGGISEQIDFYLQLKKYVSTKPRAAPGVIFAQEVPAQAEEYYLEGLEYLNDEKEIAAYESLKKSLEIFPDYYLALDRLGTEYVARGYYQAAYVLLTKAVAVNPKSFSSTFGLGLTMYRLGQTPKAIQLFEKAVEITGDSPNAHLWLGIAQLQNKDPAKAEESLLKADRLSEGTAHQVHWQLARLYNEQNKHAQSADRLELFLKYNREAGDAENIKKMIAALRRKAAANRP